MALNTVAHQHLQWQKTIPLTVCSHQLDVIAPVTDCGELGGPSKPMWTLSLVPVINQHCGNVWTHPYDWLSDVAPSLILVTHKTKSGISESIPFYVILRLLGWIRRATVAIPKNPKVFPDVKRKLTSVGPICYTAYYGRLCVRFSVYKWCSYLIPAISIPSSGFVITNTMDHFCSSQPIAVLVSKVNHNRIGNSRTVVKPPPQIDYLISVYSS